MRAIQANPKEVKKIFSDIYVIPEFQRPYTWDSDLCDQLWVDLVDFFENQKSLDDKYFLGNIVVYKDTEGAQERLIVIDGQQRLTSLSLLIRALLDAAGTYAALEECLKTKNSKTGQFTQQPRILSLVIDEDRKSLKEIILSGLNNREQDDTYFDKNIRLFQKNISEWRNGRTAPEFEKLIEFILNQVVLLPIECGDQDDALTIFQTLNNRGKPLEDSDIFKAKIYSTIQGSNNEKTEFINRWNDLENHDTLFRVHMHVKRAQNGVTDKEVGLRAYFEKSDHSVYEDYQGLLKSLEVYNRVQFLDRSETISPEIRLWWLILQTYTNNYWTLPINVFLHKYGELHEGEIILDNAREKQLQKLIKETVKYFFLKGVVHNSVNTVRDTTYRVCLNIQRDHDYLSSYVSNAQKDFEEFKRRLESLTSRYRRGVIFIGAALNPLQDPSDFIDELSSKPEIEHILPKKGENYDGWSQEEHAADIEKLGNLVPLKKKVNIAASNEYFGRKKEKYTDSKVRDAVDLCELEAWTPESLQARHNEVINRLTDFFKYE